MKTARRRLRDGKIHPWVSKPLLARFDKVVERLGFSRDGALEAAIRDFVNKHKEK